MGASGTVIAALRHRDGVLIGADSQASDPTAGVRWPCSKIRRLGSASMVMGFSGSMGSAERIFAALDAATITAKHLRDPVKLQRFIDRMVAPEYKDAQKRSFSPKGVPPIAIWGLGAVCAGGEPSILEYEVSGDSGWHDYFHAIGSGSQTAYAIYRTLGGKDLCGLSERTALAALLRIVRTSISVEVWGVSEPIHVWRVKCDSAVEIGEDELNAHWQTVDEWEQADRDRLFEADGGDPQPPPVAGAAGAPLGIPSSAGRSPRDGAA